MGVIGRLFSIIKMRAFAFVLLAAAAVIADSDPYTIGQVASGLTNGGVVAGVDYSNGVVSGVGAIGNRAYAGHVGYANHVVAAPSAYSYSSAVHAYSTPAYGYARHYYGKREAEAEPEADAYTIGQVAAGLPVANAYATGHAHNVGVVTGTTYAHAAPAVAAYTSYAAPAVASYAATYAAPAVATYAAPAVAGYTGVVASPAVHTYSALGHRYAGHYYGKREAEAEPEAYRYTYAHGLHPYTTRYNTYAAPYSGYAGHLGYAGLGYSGLGYTRAFYG